MEKTLAVSNLEWYLYGGFPTMDAKDAYYYQLERTLMAWQPRSKEEETRNTTPSYCVKA